MKPTILFILHLPPPVHGAAMMGKYIRESQLINDAFDCHYINLALAKDLADIGKGGRQKLIRYIKLLKTIFREVRRFRPSLVYVTPNAKGSAFYKEFVIVMLLKLMRQKIVVHYHNKGVATRQDRPVDNFLYRRFFKNLKVILLAEALYEDVRKYVDWKDVFICSNGIPEQNTEPGPKRNNRIPHLLFLSNLLESKGVLVLLDACRILKDKGYSFICEFVGGETGEIDARRFENEVRARRLNELVFYKGPKSGKEKQMYFKHADIFVFPTYYPNECFPLVLLEAMEAGTACISTNEGGIRDIIDEGITGFIVEKKNPHALADKMEILLNDPALRRGMGEKGHQLFKEKFTLQTFEREFINIINSSRCC